MTTQIETINGHLYSVTRDGDGNIVNMVAADPLPDPPALPPVALTHYQYRSLMTFNERVGIDNAADNPALTDDQKAVLKTLAFDFNIADNISLTDPATIQGTQLLESYGLLAAGRAAQILANQPPA